MRGEVCLQEHLFEHFNSEQDNEFLHDISVTLINKIDAKKPIKREHYWQHTLKRVLMLKITAYLYSTGTMY